MAITAQPLSHATYILSPFDGLVSKLSLLYDGTVGQSRIKQKKLVLIMGGLLGIFKYGRGYTIPRHQQLDS